MVTDCCTELLFPPPAGKLDGVHVNLLTGTNMQRRSGALLSAGDEELLDPGALLLFTKTILFKEPLCRTMSEDVAQRPPQRLL